MVPGFVIPRADDSCIIKILFKGKANPKDILCRSNAEYEKKILSHTNVYDWHKFSEDHREVLNLPRAHIQL
jgi:hypothetical protein